MEHPAERVTARELFRRGTPIRALRSRRRRFASFCFLVAGVAFGTALYLVRTRATMVYAPSSLPMFIALVGIMAGLVHLGASAEQEVSRCDEELAELEREIGRLLRKGP